MCATVLFRQFPDMAVTGVVKILLGILWLACTAGLTVSEDKPNAVRFQMFVKLNCSLNMGKGILYYRFCKSLIVKLSTSRCQLFIGSTFKTV